MRILIITNFYPPHHIGGYELGCRDVVEELRHRGHSVNVLTSTFGLSSARREGHVLRWLISDWGAPNGPARKLVHTARKEWRNQRAFRREIEEFQPDVVYLWNPRGISISLLTIAAEIGIPICAFVSDHWLADWSPRRDRWSRFSCFLEHRLPARFVGAFWRGCQSIGIVPGVTDLFVEEAHFVSRFMCDRTAAAGLQVGHSLVIHWGVHPHAFPFNPVSRSHRRRLLYVGQVMPHKGPETAIEALRHLREHLGFPDATLDIVGGSASSEYLEDLRAKVEGMNLTSAVQFRGAMSRAELPTVYQQHDVLVFPSVWTEPFSITLLEAMASGIPIVGTTTGGTAEVLNHEANALTFRVGSASECAEQIARLLRDADLYEGVRTKARHSIENQFTLTAMVDHIEARLRLAAAAAGAVQPAA